MSEHRQRLSTRDRVALFEEHKGRCHICGEKIHTTQAWEVSHPIPLAAGGADEPGNRAPAHKKCHAKQTREIDQPLIAKVKRVHARHIGAVAPPARPFPGGKRDRWKKRMDGTTVLREAKQ